MRLEIREGYDIVLIAENESDRRRLGKLNDKYTSCGVTVDTAASAKHIHRITLRPMNPEEQAIELGG